MNFQIYKSLSENKRESLGRLLAPAIGNPTEERVKVAIASYLNDRSQTLIVGEDDQEMRGCIGLMALGNQRFEILHIAIVKAFRGQGLGRVLIEESIRRLSPRELAVETDDDAIGFYY